jgi:hypothetical protein
MPFPISRRATVTLPCHPSLSVEEVAAALEQTLRDNRAGRVRRDGSHIVFDGAMANANNADPLYHITWGELHVRPIDRGVEVRYRLRLTNVVVLATLGAFLMGITASGTGFITPSPWSGLALGCGMWLLICGSSYLMSTTQFPRILRRTRFPAE